MGEAFLIQMNDFDRLLEHQLKRMLDPVVAAPVPFRRNSLANCIRAAAAANASGGAPLKLLPETRAFFEPS